MKKAALGRPDLMKRRQSQGSRYGKRLDRLPGFVTPVFL